MSILKVADRMPNQAVDAIFVLSYLVAEEDTTRLTVMSERTMLQAIVLYNVDLGNHLIFTAGDVAERDLKMKLSTLGGVSLGRISPICPVMGTTSEVRKVRELCRERGFQSLLIVAEELHMRRVLGLFRRVLPDVEIYHSSVYSPYELEYYAMKPSVSKWLKVMRSRHMLIRVFAEVAQHILTPVLVRKS